MSGPVATPAAARVFLKALADGVPPHTDLTPWLTVGQAGLLSTFEADLTAVAGGGFRSLLVLGNPGAGKSQLLITLQYIASDRGFATAYFSQDLQSRLAFNRPDQIYRRIIETMRLSNGDDETASLRSVLDRWVDRSLPVLQGTNRSMAIAYKLAGAGLLPEDVAGIHPRTRVALVGYVMATEQQNEDARLQFLSVLVGPGLTSTALLDAARAVNLQRKGFIGYTPSPYDADYYFSQLRTIIFVLRVLGYRGMVILFDEVTAIVDLAGRSREKAYKVLDSLFLNAYGYTGLYSVFAYMPPFINQLRADRLRTDKDYVERWGDLWDERMQELRPLDDREMVLLLRRIADLHGLARGWPAWARVEEDAHKLVAASARGRVATRDLVRQGLGLLDRHHAIQ